MKQEHFDANQAWGEKHITQLQHPISEFNARGGAELEDYLAYRESQLANDNELGKKQWAEIEPQLSKLELMQDPKSGQHLRVQRYNWPEDEAKLEHQPVTITPLQFSVPIDSKNIQYQNFLLAQALGKPFMVFENPSYGESDKLTPAQKHGLKKDSDYGSVAESMLGIIQTLGIKKINGLGYSMGADTIGAIAANAKDFGVGVEQLVIVDDPRVAAQKPMTLGRNYLSEGGNLKFVWRHPVDPVVTEIAELKPTVPKGLISYGRAMTKGGLRKDLDKAFSDQPDMKLTLVRAGSSRISPAKANQQLAKDLRVEHPDHAVREIVMPGESHVFRDSAKRYAALAKFVLRKS